MVASIPAPKNLPQRAEVPPMKSATITTGELFGTKRGIYIRADYRYTNLKVVSCLDSFMRSEITSMKKFLAGLGFTHVYEPDGKHVKLEKV